MVGQSHSISSLLFFYMFYVRQSDLKKRTYSPTYVWCRTAAWQQHLIFWLDSANAAPHARHHSMHAWHMFPSPRGKRAADRSLGHPR
jgi:hypothetical protein